MYYLDLPYGIACSHPDMDRVFIRVKGNYSTQILIVGENFGQLASIYEFVIDLMDDEGFGVVGPYGDLEQHP